MLAYTVTPLPPPLTMVDYVPDMYGSKSNSNLLLISISFTSFNMQHVTIEVLVASFIVGLICQSKIKRGVGCDMCHNQKHIAINSVFSIENLSVFYVKHTRANCPMQHYHMCVSKIKK